MYPDFDDNLRQAFRRETELFVESILREDRSVLDLLRANYTFVNERLAKHYGIPYIYGSRFRRVTFEEDATRGGLLRHGSILALTSYATRTSPVVRGNWILGNILGVPAPPPPPDIPDLQETRSIGKELSMRQRLAEHRANPVCASCHKLMDPVGFALENYDAIGRFRTVEAGVPIDSCIVVVGELPGMRPFTQRLDLTGLFEPDPRVNHIFREHIAAEQVVEVFQLERARALGSLLVARRKAGAAAPRVELAWFDGERVRVEDLRDVLRLEKRALREAFLNGLAPWKNGLAQGNVRTDPALLPTRSVPAALTVTLTNR